MTDLGRRRPGGKISLQQRKPYFNMPTMFRSVRAVALLALLAVPTVHAQLTNLPTLSSASLVTSLDKSTASQSEDGKSKSTQAASTSTSDAATSSVSSAASTSSFPPLTSSTTSSPTFAESATGTSSSFAGGLTDVPTLAGVGIPTLVIPYTANAPFMQKSNLPEGTVFITVGAVLAFLGACVLLWRGLVAWSINRSVKRAALASIRGSEKTSTWGGSGVGYNPAKGGSRYAEYPAGSNVSLDALTSAGKPLNKPHFRDNDSHARHSSAAAPPAGLFFSPTAQTSNRQSSATFENPNRSSTFLPAGYYASASATQPAGGANTTTVGGSLAPYARHSVVGPSPPTTPNQAPTSRTTASYYGGNGSRDGLRSHDGLRSSSTEGLRHQNRESAYGSRPSSYAQGGIYNHRSSSSLMVGTGGAANPDSHTSTRAPSAYLDDLFENHGNGPRERFQ